MRKVKYLLFITVTCLLLSGCNSQKNYDKETEIIKESVSQYINGSDKESIQFEEDDDGLHIGVIVKDNYSEFNKKKQWDVIETAVVSLGTNSSLKEKYKQIYVSFNNSDNSWEMNVYGERKMNFSQDFDSWMTQYFDTSGEAVYYPSYNDDNAPL